MSVEGWDVEMELSNLSVGGFAIICRRPFKPGMTHRFTISSPSYGLSVTVVAKAVHSRPSDEGGELQFKSGWEFMLGVSPDDKAAISLMVAVAVQPG